MQLLGALGVILFLAGVGLLWHSREGIVEWLRFVVLTWRAALTRMENEGRPRQSPRGAVRLVGGVGLMVLGQLLLLLVFFL